MIKKAPLKFQTNCVSPPDFFLLRSRTIFYLKKPPLKNEAIKNAPRKTKLQNKCPPEICTARPHVQSAQKQPYLTSQFRGALLTQSVTLEFSQDTGCTPNNQDLGLKHFQILPEVLKIPIRFGLPYNNLISLYE